MNAPPTSGTREKQDLLETTTEEDTCIDQKVVLKKGDFITVKYDTNKSNIMYIGQVVKRTNLHWFM